MGGVQKWTIVAQYASNMKLSLRPHVVTDFVSLVSYRLILEFANDWQQKGPENTTLLIFRPQKYFCPWDWASFEKKIEKSLRNSIIV